MHTIACHTDILILWVRVPGALCVKGMRLQAALFATGVGVQKLVRLRETHVFVREAPRAQPSPAPTAHAPQSQQGPNQAPHLLRMLHGLTLLHFEALECRLLHDALPHLAHMQVKMGDAVEDGQRSGLRCFAGATAQALFFTTWLRMQLKMGSAQG